MRAADRPTLGLVAIATAALAIAASAGCATAPPEPERPRYPASWWAPLPPGTEKPSWEITPDQAKPGEVILSKRNELGVFSNFAATPFTLDGRRYASIEGLWQSLWYPEGADDPRAAVGPWKHTRAEVEQLTAFEAKRAGDDAKKRLAEKGIHWMTYRGRRFEPKGGAEDRRFHYELIERATRAKVDQNPEVRRLLLATGDLILRPDHTQPADAPPSYGYFELLMKIRSDLRASRP